MNTVMTEPTTPPSSPNLTLPQPGFEPVKKRSHLGLWITLGVLGLLIVGGASWYFYNFHAWIRPVNLSEQEKQVVKHKIDAIETAGGGLAASSQNPASVPDDVLRESNQVRVQTPEQKLEAQKQEREDRRTVTLTQREINGMLNYNSDVGQHLKFDLKPGYIDIQYVQPIPQDVKFVGGQTWRISMDISLNKVRGGKMEMKVQDISIGGIPIPAAWLDMIGIPKNEDLIAMIKREMPGFEKIEKGIEYVDIGSGQMKIRLAE